MVGLGDDEPKRVGLPAVTAAHAEERFMAKRTVSGLAVVVLAAVGCGPPLTTVSGVVTLEGAAVPDAIVSFFPTHGDGQTAAVRTDSAGGYRAVISPTEMSVTISLPRQVKEIPQPWRPRSMSPDEWAESLPPRYSAREKTDLRVTPQPGGHVSVDFALTTE